MTFDDDELASMMRVTLTFDISSLTLEKYVYADDIWNYNYVKQLYYIMISLSVCVTHTINVHQLKLERTKISFQYSRILVIIGLIKYVFKKITVVGTFYSF